MFEIDAEVEEKDDVSNFGFCLFCDKGLINVNQLWPKRSVVRSRIELRPNSTYSIQKLSHRVQLFMCVLSVFYP